LSPTPKSVKIAIYGWTLDSHRGVGCYPILSTLDSGSNPEWYEAVSSFVVPLSWHGG